MFCVNELEENTWIRSKYNVDSTGDVWIGYTDMPPYGRGKGTKQYGWVTGCSSTYTTGWTSGNPDNAGNNEDYVCLNEKSQWNDREAQAKMNCGCQYTLKAPTYSPSTVAPTTSSPSTVAPTTSSPSTPSTTVPSKDGFFTCHWKFYSSQPGSVFQQDSLMTSSAVDSETVPEFDYFYYVVFAGLALGSLLTLLIQASLYCCTRKAYALATADRSEYLPIIGRE